MISILSSTAYNRAYLAPLRSAQIPLRGTSDTLGTLTKMTLRSSRRIGTHFGQRLAGERKASAENQPKDF